MTAPTARRRELDVLAAVAAGGALGSLGRWAVAEALPHQRGELAWSTVLVNVSGCLALGVLMALVLGEWGRFRLLRPFVGVGVLGGWTTFSTAALDLRDQLAAGAAGTALAYLALSLGVGLLATWAGLLVGGGLPGGRAPGAADPTDPDVELEGAP